MRDPWSDILLSPTRSHLSLFSSSSSSSSSSSFHVGFWVWLHFFSFPFLFTGFWAWVLSSSFFFFFFFKLGFWVWLPIPHQNQPHRCEQPLNPTFCLTYIKTHPPPWGLSKIMTVREKKKKTHGEQNLGPHQAHPWWQPRNDPAKKNFILSKKNPKHHWKTHRQSDFLLSISPEQKSTENAEEIVLLVHVSLCLLASLGYNGGDSIAGTRRRNGCCSLVTVLTRRGSFWNFYGFGFGFWESNSGERVKRK